MNRHARILVVDDEVLLRNLLEMELEHAGFTVLLAQNAAQGFRILRQEKPDAVILDLNLPDSSGADLCQRVRQDSVLSTVPILILTGDQTEDVSSSCLDSGADDFLQKPFITKELIARLRALLRRPRMYAADDSTIMKGRIKISRSERRVFIRGRAVGKFAPKEFELLCQLVIHSPNVLDKKVLARKVWGMSLDQLNQRTLDVHVRRVRQKLGSSGGCLKTVPAIGFQWIEPDRR
jgi:two-component system phosphate regulon response regulator PhoB